MTELDPAPRRVVRSVGSSVGEAVRLSQVLAFWVGVALPFVYLPLIAGGFAGPDVTPFVALVAVNCLALLVGAGYGRRVTTGD